MPKSQKQYVTREVREAMLRSIRSSGLTQEHLAHKLGVSRPYLTRILNGKAPMAQLYVLAIKFILLEHRLGRV